MNEGHEDQRLDEAIRKADDLLVGSLQQAQRHRRKTIGLWIAAAFAIVLILALGMTFILYRVEKKRQATAAAQQAFAEAMKRQVERKSTPATAPDSSSGISLQTWEQSLIALKDDNWAKAFAVGNELVELPPETGWSILAANYKKIPSPEARQQIIKAFDFAHHPHLLDVLDLGMRDEAQPVRTWAVGYLKAFAWKDFGEDSSGYDAWREKTKGRSLDEVTADSARNWTEQAKAAKGEQIVAMAKVLDDVDNDLGQMPVAQKAVKDAGAAELALRWLKENPQNQDLVRGVERLLHGLKPDDDFLKSAVLPLVAKDQPLEVRVVAVGLLSINKGQWAVDPLLDVLQQALHEKQRPLIWPAAQALSEIGEARSIPPMIAVIAADYTYDTVYGVGYFGLSQLTGVNYDAKHNGAWWKQWWERERKRYPEPVRSMNIPNLSRSSEARSSAHVIYAATDGGDAPAVQDLRAGGVEEMRYFVIGPKGKTAPKDGYRLLLVLPGGDGSAEFNPFVTNICANALSDQYIVAELVAPKWRDDENRIVWPIEKGNDAKAKFTTEKFIDSVVEDVKKQLKIDDRYVFGLAWSSGGPALYAASLRENTPITAAFVAMSVFHPDQYGPAKNAKGRAFYILHSPQDFIPMTFPNNAKKMLSSAGAKVQLQTYEGGHGWHGNIFGTISTGVKWLEKNVPLKSPASSSE